MARRAHYILAAAAAILLIGPVSGALAAAKPVVQSTYSEKVETEGANLKAVIDPNGAAATYYFEYTSEAGYEENGFEGALRSPEAEEKSLGTKNKNASVHIAGLLPFSTYRFRVIAKNELGTTEGPPRSMTTDEGAPVFALPDSRGWELVSPADKNGGQVDAPETDLGGGAFQASADGDAVTYTSLDSFGVPLGSPGASQYLSRRGENSWRTDNLTVGQYSGGYDTSAGAGAPYRIFSTDLGTGILTNGRRCRSEGSGCPVANLPLAGSGAPGGYRNYYLRDNSDGSFQAVLTTTDISGLTLGSEDFELEFAGATPDLEHVILSTCAALTAEAEEVPGSGGECDPEEANLYEKSGTSLQLINLKPGAGTGTPGASLAAQGGAISTDGSRVYWTDTTHLYLWEDGQSIELDEAPGTGPGATFQTASADGGVAFFTNAAGHLWRYDVATETATDLTPGGGVAGVLGASTDGTYVYFQTAAGISLWHAGTTTPVSGVADASNYPPATGTARVSPGGQVLVFLSSADLTDFNSNGNAEVYLYSPATGLICPSCNPSGELPKGPSLIPGAVANGDALKAYKPRVLSDSGTRLFFETPDALITTDANIQGDVYQWEAEGSGGCAQPDGCLGLLSSGGDASSKLIDASADGGDVFFLTEGSLVPGDPGSADLYDARVGGGFPAPQTPIACVGDSCQPLPGEPEDPTPGTILEGTGNRPLTLPKKKKHKHKHAKPKRHRSAKHGGRGR